MNEFSEIHLPVLCNEVVAAAQLGADLRAADRGNRTDSLSPLPTLIAEGTLGEGGHTLALHRALPEAAILSLDRDLEMIERAERRLSAAGVLTRRIGLDESSGTSNERFQIGPGEVVLCHAPFRRLGEAISRCNSGFADFVLLDLGVSMYHFRAAGRGFSYSDDTLDMRLDPSAAASESAADLLMRLSESELSDLIWRYGEERHSRRIARAIVENRPFTSAIELAELVRLSVPPLKWRKGGSSGTIHPATRLFQALRIAVNDELGELEAALHSLPQRLAAGGIFAAISFHSLEDRAVKERFHAMAIRERDFERSFDNRFYELLTGCRVSVIDEKSERLKRSEERRRRNATAKGDARADDEHNNAEYRLLLYGGVVPGEKELTLNPAARSSRLRLLQKRGRVADTMRYEATPGD